MNACRAPPRPCRADPWARGTTRCPSIGRNMQTTHARQENPAALSGCPHDPADLRPRSPMGIGDNQLHTAQAATQHALEEGRPDEKGRPEGLRTVGLPSAFAATAVITAAEAVRPPTRQLRWAASSQRNVPARPGGGSRKAPTRPSSPSHSLLTVPLPTTASPVACTGSSTHRAEPSLTPSICFAAQPRVKAAGAFPGPYGLKERRELAALPQLRGCAAAGCRAACPGPGRGRRCGGSRGRRIVRAARRLAGCPTFASVSDCATASVRRKSPPPASASGSANGSLSSIIGFSSVRVRAPQRHISHPIRGPPPPHLQGNLSFHHVPGLYFGQCGCSSYAIAMPLQREV